MALFLFSGSALVRADAVSIDLYMKLDKTPSESKFLTGYLAGIMHSYGFANVELEIQKRTPLFCPPGKLALGPENVRQLLNDEIEETRKVAPEEHWKTFKTFSAASVALSVLQDTFPCKSVGKTNG